MMFTNTRCIAVLAGLMAAAPALAADLPATELNVVGTWSNLSQYKNFEKPFWEEHIPEASGGAVSVTVQGFNDMGLKGNEVVRLMEQGVVDFGSTVLGYLAADDAMNEAIDLAGLAPDVETARRISDAFKPVLAERYASAYDIKLLGIWPYSAQVIFCNTPISRLDDLAGKKVRTANRTLAEFVETLGGTGVTMAFSEVVPSMQKGVVDCAITGSLSGYSAKWHEVATHLIALPVGWSQVMHAVSTDAWNGLDPAVQTFLETEIARLEDDIWTAAAYESEQGISCNTGGQCDFGEAAAMTLVPVTDADLAKVQEVLTTVVVPQWAERCGESCAQAWNASVGEVVSLKAQ